MGDLGQDLWICHSLKVGVETSVLSNSVFQVYDESLYLIFLHAFGQRLFTLLISLYLSIMHWFLSRSWNPHTLLLYMRGKLRLTTNKASKILSEPG